MEPAEAVRKNDQTNAREYSRVLTRTNTPILWSVGVFVRRVKQADELYELNGEIARLN